MAVTHCPECRAEVRAGSEECPRCGAALVEAGPPPAAPTGASAREPTPGSTAGAGPGGPPEAGEANAPGEPTAPGEPNAPGEPTAPGEPIAPREPTAPGEPTVPREPVAPPTGEEEGSRLGSVVKAVGCLAVLGAVLFIATLLGLLDAIF